MSSSTPTGMANASDIRQHAAPPQRLNRTRAPLGLFASSEHTDISDDLPRKYPKSRNATDADTVSNLGSEDMQIDDGVLHTRGLSSKRQQHMINERRSRLASDDHVATGTVRRQYGRRRRLNSETPKIKAAELTDDPTDIAATTATTTTTNSKRDKTPSSSSRNSSFRPPLRRGDSRTLFAPLCLPHTDVVHAGEISTLSSSNSHHVEGKLNLPTIGSAVSSASSNSGGTPSSSMLARQLIMIASKLATQTGTGGVAASLVAGNNGGNNGGVRPRASMPVINGAHRPPQRTRSQVSRKTKDELTGALTMKSVEIRGGRIVLDDPSSSEASDSDDSYMSDNEHRHHRDEDGNSEDDDNDSRVFNGNSIGLGLRGGTRRSRLDSMASNRSDYTRGCHHRPSINSAIEAMHWEETLRSRWYTRRCLGLRQPFESVHRLVKAEHDSDNSFPLINDLRKILIETRGCTLVADKESVDGEHVDVLLCTDAIIICAATQSTLADACNQEKVPDLRAIEFADELVVRVADDNDNVVYISDDVQSAILNFPAGGARQWTEQVVQARSRFDLTLQDLRLDEEDFVEKPPPPLLLTRGRTSIAGTMASADMISTTGMPLRMRNAHQGGVYWVPDNETNVCMVCHKTTFSMMVRRHHCRGCGLVICYRCSTVDKERHRLCVRCSNINNGRRSNNSNAIRPKPSPSLHTLGRRAAEYLPSGDVVMQIAAQREAAQAAASSSASVVSMALDANDNDNLASESPSATSTLITRIKNERRTRRPISTLFNIGDDEDDDIMDG